MRRSANKYPLKNQLIYSALLHIAVFFAGFISFLLPKPDNATLMSIEIASEGELQELLEKTNEPISPEEHKIEEVEKPTQSEITSPTPEQKAEPKTEPEQNNKPEQPSAHDEKIEKSESEKEDIQEKIEKDANEEPVPKLEEKKVEEKKPKKKPPKKRNKKAMLDVIKKLENQKKKAERRKKLQEIAKKEAKKKKTDGEFEKILSGSINDLKKTSSSSSGKGRKGTGAGSFGSVGNSLTENDIGIISAQIYPHWAVPSGIKDAENIIVEIRVNLKNNGEVITSSVKILDEKRYATDYIFRAAADSAKRAILEASPLTIPRDKIEMFKDFVFRFNLKEALGI